MDFQVTRSQDGRYSYARCHKVPAEPFSVHRTACSTRMGRQGSF